MNRKDYRRIAAALYTSRPDGATDVGAIQLSQWRFSVRIMADILEDENPFFSREKFLAACGHGE